MLLKVRNYSYYYFRLDFFFTTVDVPAIALVVFLFFCDLTLCVYFSCPLLGRRPRLP